MIKKFFILLFLLGIIININSIYKLYKVQEKLENFHDNKKNLLINDIINNYYNRVNGLYYLIK